MAKTFISINAVVATLASDKALLDAFPGFYEAKGLVRPSPREAVNIAITVGVADASRPKAFADHVAEVVALDGTAELQVDLSKIGALREVCAKLGRQAFAGGQQRTMRTFGLDDGHAQNAGEHLDPLLAAIAATVRAQAASLKG